MSYRYGNGNKDRYGRNKQNKKYVHQWRRWPQSIDLSVPSIRDNCFWLIVYIRKAKAPSTRKRRDDKRRASDRYERRLLDKRREGGTSIERLLLISNWYNVAERVGEVTEAALRRNLLCVEKPMGCVCVCEREANFYCVPGNSVGPMFPIAFCQPITRSCWNSNRPPHQPPDIYTGILLL